MKEIRDALRILSENYDAQPTQVKEASNTANAAPAGTMSDTAIAVAKVIDMVDKDNTAKLTQLIEKSGYTGDHVLVIHSDYVGVKWGKGAQATVTFDATFNSDDGEIIGGCAITINNGKLSFDWGGDGAFYHDDSAEDENW